MRDFQVTAVIRDRGQLTIPEKIRRFLWWSSPDSVVSLTATSKDQLVVSPFEGNKKIDWADVWMKIDLTRSYTGKRGNLSQFISSDRKSH